MAPLPIVQKPGREMYKSSGTKGGRIIPTPYIMVQAPKIPWVCVRRIWTTFNVCLRFSKLNTTPHPPQCKITHLTARYFSHAGLARVYFFAFCARHARRNKCSLSVPPFMTSVPKRTPSSVREVEPCSQPRFFFKNMIPILVLFHGVPRPVVNVERIYLFRYLVAIQRVRARLALCLS